MKRLLIILTLAGLPCAPFAQTRLTLDACIEQAEANNKALAAADRQLAAAQFDFRSARANFFPSFSATGTGLYSTADGGLDIAGGALPVLGVDGMPTGGPRPESRLRGGLGLRRRHNARTAPLHGRQGAHGLSHGADRQ